MQIQQKLGVREYTGDTMDFKEWFINYLKSLESQNREILWDTLLEIPLIAGDQTSCCNGGPCDYQWGTDYIVFAVRDEKDIQQRQKMKFNDTKAILYIVPKEKLTMIKFRVCPEWIVCDEQELYEQFFFFISAPSSSFFLFD